MKNKGFLVVLILYSWFFLNCDFTDSNEKATIDLHHTAIVEEDQVNLEFDNNFFFIKCTDYIVFYKIEDDTREKLITDTYTVDKEYYVEDVYYNESFIKKESCEEEEFTETDNLKESLLFAQVVGQKEAPDSSDLVNVYSFQKVSGSIEFDLTYYVYGLGPACTIPTYVEYSYTGNFDVEETVEE